MGVFITKSWPQNRSNDLERINQPEKKIYLPGNLICDNSLFYTMIAFRSKVSRNSRKVM